MVGTCIQPCIQGRSNHCSLSEMSLVSRLKFHLYQLASVTKFKPLKIDLLIEVSRISDQFQEAIYSPLYSTLFPLKSQVRPLANEFCYITRRMWYVKLWLMFVGNHWLMFMHLPLKKLRFMTVILKVFFGSKIYDLWILTLTQESSKIIGGKTPG